MSKTASKNLLIPDPSEELIVSEPWTMDTYADGLMDELFSDIDCILDRKGNLSKQIVQPQQELILHQATPPQVVAPPTIISPIQQAQQRHIEARLDSVLRGNAPKTTKVKTRRKIWRNLGQILKVGAGLGLAIALGNWAISSGLLNRLTSKSLQFALQEPALQQKVLEAQSVQSAAPTQAQIRSDLADYMLGALEIIDRQQDTQDRASANNIARATPVPANQATLAYANQPVANLPAPKIANNTKPLQTRNTRVVERIYIPVYQAPQPMRYAPPEIAQAPAPTPLPPVNTASQGVAPKPSDGKAKKPAPVKVAKAKTPEKIAAFASIREIKPVAVKSKPVSVKQAPEIPKMKQGATIAPSPEVSAAPVEKPVKKVASAPTPSHVLEGLLELGEQSAALFKVNGVSRRIQKGESIGASGWTLVDVANGEAIIRRNGEVRSIFAGQKF
jgi:type II secretory pathway component PulC